MPSPTIDAPAFRQPPGPLHAMLLAGTVPLFLGALLSDLAYYNSYQIQWSNFASWLIAGALVLGGCALLFALVALVRSKGRKGPELVHFLLLLATWVVGLIDAFVHAKDAWAAMPSGLYLSIAVTVLACVTAWRALATRTGGAR